MSNQAIYSVSHDIPVKVSKVGIAVNGPVDEELRAARPGTTFKDDLQEPNLLDYITPETAKALKRMRMFNFIVGIVHLIIGIILVVAPSKYTLNITVSYLSRVNQTAVGPPLLTLKSATLFSSRLAPAVSAFNFMSALAHFIIVAPYFTTIWQRNLLLHINFFRWIEYSFSASWMMCIIGALFGISDLAAHFALFGLTACMNLFGWAMERHNQCRRALGWDVDWLSYWLGWIPGILIWIVVAIYYGAGEDKAPGQTPPFVVAIYFTLLVLFNVFPINMYLQYKGVGKWKNYLYGENTYIIASLVAKTLLAFLVYGGSFGPDRVYGS